MRETTWLRSAAIALGMTCFWAFFRYQSFFGVLYPAEAVAGVGLLPGLVLVTRTHTLLLVLLLVGTLVLMALSGRPRFAQAARHPAVVVCCSTLMAMGSVTALLVNAGRLAPWAAPVSCLLVAVGFFGVYLAWADLCSGGEGGLDLPMLAGSFMASIALSGAVARFFPAALEATVVAMPLVTGVCWLIASRAVGAGQPCVFQQGETPEGLVASLRKVPFYVVLFLGFLVAGAVVRGVVDHGVAASASQGIRLPVSLLVAGVMLVACVLVVGRRGRASHALVERFALGSWVVLAMLIIVGIVWGLASGTYEQAGQLVVVARSTLDFVLWVFLCNVVVGRKVAPSGVFLACGMLVEAVSWLLSYSVVSHLLGLDLASGTRSAQDMLVMGSLLVLVLMLVLALGVLYLRKGAGLVGQADSEQDGRAAADEPGASAVPAVVPSELPAEFVARYRLTPRESQIVWMFSQGHSIKYIASELVVSVGTAQSHIRSAYRKLGIHSRDELIAIVRSCAGGQH